MADAPSDRRAALVRDLARLVGDSSVLTDPTDCAFFAQDIARAGRPAACVVQPRSVEALAQATALVTNAGFVAVPRGGGASYTGGYVADRSDAVVIDTRGLDRIVEVNERDMYVTVECGCTWRRLTETLRGFGLRTPFWGPLSGAFATIGGALSQHAILWGSARYGLSAESVLGLDVVLADGTILTTGSGAVRGATPFFRHYGPDLTGLFLGDSGALGIKARATLRLIRRPAVFDTASFGFETHEALADAMAAIAREGIATECFGMDPVLQRQRMKRAGLAKDLQSLAAVVRSASGLASGVRDAAKVALAGRRFLEDVPYSLHVGTEGRDEASVAAAMAELRRLAAGHGGQEIENTIPRVLRGDPFMPMSSGIGPSGERWLPVHGVVRLSDAAACWTAVRQLFAEYTTRIAQHRIEIGVLTAIVGSQAFVLEPVFYWPAPRTLYYDRMLDPELLARFQSFPPNPEGEALVFEVRDRLTSLFLERGAMHLQIGRTYRYREGLLPPAWRLVEALKRAVDPAGRINPGSLGLADSLPPSP